MKNLKLILTSSAVVIAVAASLTLQEKKQSCPCIQISNLQKNLTDSANFLHRTP